MRRRVTFLLALLVVAATLGVVLTKSRRGAASVDRSHQAGADGTGQAKSHAHADMGAHMRMTAARPVQPGDEGRAEEVAKRARAAVEKYKDYRAALRDGYQILLPHVPQKMYHFNHAGYYAEAERRFNPEHPTSLLYEKRESDYRLIGVMYTAAADLTEDELDARIPLSMAAWHQHVNVCLPEGDPLQNLFGNGTRFGLEGSISNEAECRKEGGRFYPRLFGWMVHLYPYERTAREMWSVERQMEDGGGHAH
ncbi:MAG TPA: hypothetical protein VGW12_08230 [Pyrinomonadaceae bacterium]|nr:hypothetical protein [Pyrinomonadaceae bacterium]